MRIPYGVVSILNKLSTNGYKGYIVGGAVRDYIMGREPHDWDIATNAKPEYVKEIFEKTIDTGIKHGTVTALIDGEGFEITTYRADGKYSDGRHPDGVRFMSRIEDDLGRRDFTINAMAMDINGQIVDPYNGLDDIKNGIIRCVGNPDERFSEDALRMMRAVRFESKFGFELDDSVKNAIKRNVSKLSNVSSERIRDEFTKMLSSDNPKKGFVDAYETGITAMVLPEFDRMMECEQNVPSHYANVGIHSLDVVEYVRPEPNLRWAALLHDVGKPTVKGVNAKGYDSFYHHPEKSAEISGNILSRLKFSNADKKEIKSLVEMHDFISNKDSKIRYFAAKYGEDFVTKLGELKEADANAHVKGCSKEFIEGNRRFIEKAIGFIKDGTAIKPKDLKINGNELSAYGIVGKDIAKFMQSAYLDCLGQPELNTNEMLCKRAKQHQERVESATKKIQNLKQSESSKQYE